MSYWRRTPFDEAWTGWWWSICFLAYLGQIFGLWWN